MDPSIPTDTEDFESKGIWPELRRAEANRFAVQLRDAIADTKVFRSVRVFPDQSATGHLYVMGKILTSTGEDIRLKVSVTDITGKTLMNKNYTHRVKEYELENPRSTGQDLYTPIFKKMAADVVKLVRRMKSRDKNVLEAVAGLRFATSFSPDYFAGYISTSRTGLTKLVSVPSDDDPMLKRISALRVRDQMFIDNMQVDYDRFRVDMDRDYLSWQKQAFVESKAARKARAAASAKMLLGVLAVVGGIAMAANSDPDSTDVYGAAAVAAVGVGAIVAGVENSRDAKAHRESMSELGRSLNIQIAPRVMELEGKEIELVGTATEQYQTWRAFLKEYHVMEQTPNISM
jgi:hypothetical protein